MNASSTIMRLKLHLAGINPVMIFLLILIRTPWIQRVTRIISRSVLCKYFDWNSRKGKWRVRAILFIFAIFSLLLFKLVLYIASAPGIVNTNLLYAVFYCYCVAGAGFLAVFWIALARTMSNKIKEYYSIVIHSNFYSKIEIYAYRFLGRDIEPEIRPPLPNSDC